MATLFSICLEWTTGPNYTEGFSKGEYFEKKFVKLYRNNEEIMYKLL